MVAIVVSIDWQPLSGLTFSVGVPCGTVGGSSGNELTINGQNDLPVVFTPVLATAVKIDIFDTSASNNNVVLTELFVYTATLMDCVGGWGAWGSCSLTQSPDDEGPFTNKFPRWL